MGDPLMLTLYKVKSTHLCQFPNKIKPKVKLAKVQGLALTTSGLHYWISGISLATGWPRFRVGASRKIR